MPFSVVFFRHSLAINEMSFQSDSDNATAFEVSDAQQSMAVVENMRSPYDNDNAMIFEKNVPSLLGSIPRYVTQHNVPYS